MTFCKSKGLTGSKSRDILKKIFTHGKLTTIIHFHGSKS